MRYLDQRIAEEQKTEVMNRQSSINYSADGPNARISVNSADSSINISVRAPLELFNQIKMVIDKIVTEEPTRVALKTSVDDLGSSTSKASAYERDAQFVALAANHATLLAVLGPYIAELTHWMGTLSR